MKTFVKQSILGIAALLTLMAFSLSAHAQSNYIINNFDTADEVTNNNGFPWINWFGTAYFTNVWDASDASNNPGSGSMKIVATFPDAGVGGMFGPQFVVMDNYGGVNPPNGLNGFQITNFQCDVRFDPTSQTQISGGTTNFGNLEFGSRGTGFNQPDFGNIVITADQTNWVHVSLPVNANLNAQLTNIPNVFVKMFSSTFTGTTILYVDNVKLVGPTITVTNPPPTMSVQTATPGLRMFAGSTSTINDREQLATLDPNQSWVGGTYPVTYSYTLRNFPTIPNGSLFRFHIFLVPTNFAGGISFTANQYIDYVASNNLWLNVTAINPTNYTVDLSWKTNLPNMNPNNQAIFYTNSASPVGTWKLTFTDASDGTITAPGFSPVAFSIPAAAAAQFVNPVVAFFGVEPDSGFGEGQFADVTKIQTSGIAAPGVPVNDDFTTDATLNTSIWDPTDSALPASVVLVTTNNPFWVSWTTPDPGFGLEISPDLTNSADWHLPGAYNGFFGNQGTGTQFGLAKWVLVTPDILPSNTAANGNPLPSTNGSAFFRLVSPPPDN